MSLHPLNKKNIDNLTSLWQKMGTQQVAPQYFNASLSWPNRYWFDWDTDINPLALLNTSLTVLPSHAIVPVWNAIAGTPNAFEKALGANNFAVSLIQTAMYLPLKDQDVIESVTADIARIHSRKEIETWTAIASEAFGYKIDVDVIARIAADPDVQLLLLSYEGQAVATALLYKTADTIGVHLVGVPKRYGGKGIAYRLMQAVINRSKTWGGSYITLQASLAGEGIYRRLGFTPQFVIKSYQKIR